MLTKYKAYSAAAVLGIALFLFYFLSIPLVSGASIRFVAAAECAKAKEIALARELVLSQPAPMKSRCNLYDKQPRPIDFPYTAPEGRPDRSVTEVTLYYTPFWSGLFDVAANGTIDTIEINGVTVLRLYDAAHTPPYFYPDQLDLSPYLAWGKNTITVYTSDKKTGYLINIDGQRPIWVHAAILCLVAFALYTALFLVQAHHRYLGQRLYEIIGYVRRNITPDYLVVAALPIACMIAFDIAYDYNPPDLRNTSVKFLIPSVRLLPVLIGFLLWFHKFRKESPPPLALHPVALLITLAATETAFDLLWNSWSEWRNPVTIVGMVASVFVWIDPRAALRFILKQKRFTLVAAVAASTVMVYVRLYKTLGVELAAVSAKAVYAILYLAGMNIGIKENSENTIIASDFFGLKIYWGCSGLEGILIFSFLLSVVLLLDWPLFKHRKLLLIYLFGLVYMLCFNVLRIASLFTLGYWAYNPHAWKWAHALGGTPVYMFHSYAGWGYYLIAFALFIVWLYRSHARSKSLP